MIRQSHYSILKKSRICSTIDYLKAFNVPHLKSKVFMFYKASKRSN